MKPIEPLQYINDADLNPLIAVLRAQPAPQLGPVLPLLSLTSKEGIDQFAVGCDADLGERQDVGSMNERLVPTAWIFLIGGKSTVHLDLGPEGKGRLWGTLSNDLNPGRRKEGVIERGGYAGMRNKVRNDELPLH